MIRAPEKTTMAQLYMSSVGEEVRRVRKRRRWTRNDLVAKLEVCSAVEISTQTVATYELGTRAMTIGRFWEMCAVLRVRPSEILRAVDERIFGGHGPGGIIVSTDRLGDADNDRLSPAILWARTVRCYGRDVVDLSPSALELLAELCQVRDARHLVTLLAGYEVTEGEWSRWEARERRPSGRQR